MDLIEAVLYLNRMDYKAENLFENRKSINAAPMALLNVEVCYLFLIVDNMYGITYV